MEKYEIFEVLGRGSYGVARLARWRGPVRNENDSEELGDGDLQSLAFPADQLFVVKEIDLSDMSRSARQEAQKEVAVLKSLSHPNVVAYVESFLDSQRLWIVMEFADGGDIASAIQRRKELGGLFTEPQVLSAFAQCCAGLKHIHGKRILHRDLKCQNIFLMVDGIVKLGDFGIAKILDHTTSKAKTAVGTPYYACPEVCDNMPYGFKADIWSLGIVLYELMALEQPFRAPSLVALVLRILQSEPKPLPDSFSQACKDVCRRTLLKRPEDRPSCSELLELPVIAEALDLCWSSCPPSLLRPPSPKTCSVSPKGTTVLESTMIPTQFSDTWSDVSSAQWLRKADRNEIRSSDTEDAVDALLAALSEPPNIEEATGDVLAGACEEWSSETPPHTAQEATCDLLAGLCEEWSADSRPQTAEEASFHFSTFTALEAHLVQKEQEMQAANMLALHKNVSRHDNLEEAARPMSGLRPRRNPLGSELFGSPEQCIVNNNFEDIAPEFDLLHLEAKLGPCSFAPFPLGKPSRPRRKRCMTLEGMANNHRSSPTLLTSDECLNIPLPQLRSLEADTDPTSPLTMACQLNIPGAVPRNRPPSREEQQLHGSRCRTPSDSAQLPSMRRGQRVMSLPESSFHMPSARPTRVVAPMVSAVQAEINSWRVERGKSFILQRCH